MDDGLTPRKNKPRKPTRRGKWLLLAATALICLAASYFAYASDITANAHRSSLIIGAFLGIVNFTLFISIIAATILFIADLTDGN